MKLFGKFTLSIDGRGRLCIPPAFRHQLPSTLLITIHFKEKCLAIYTRESWERYCEAIQEEMADEQEAKQWIRDRSPFIFTMSMNSDGRILIPEQLCSLLPLGEECVMIGLRDHIELHQNMASLGEGLGEELKIIEFSF